MFRKLSKIVSIGLLILTFSIQSVFASEFITIYGHTNRVDTDITIMALKKGTNVNNILPGDITYLAQEQANLDGSFTFSIPLEGDYDFYSNTSDLNIFDPASGKETVYVSSSGDNTNGKTPATAFTSLEAAYAQLYRVGEIILMENTTYVEPPVHDGNLTIKGNTPSIVLTVPDELSFQSDITLDNLVINGTGVEKKKADGDTLCYVLTVFANGHSVEFGRNLTCAPSKWLDMYGGKKNAELVGDTDIRLFGGTYYYVYGGGYYGKVTGNTNVVFGGNSNSDQSISDDDANASLCMVHGGGHVAMVTGETNVTVQDNAVAKYVMGAGYGSSSPSYAPVTNIFINGGKVMNVYGGSYVADIADVETNITMTGGLVESIFGGSYGYSLTGNSHTNINILGGDVSRRVYSGCYNDWSWSWKSSAKVNGTTTLRIGPGAALLTKTELSSGNQDNMGIFSGSRISNSADLSAEVNTLIFLDGSYSKFSSKVGDQSGWGSTMKSFADYTVQASTGGDVLGTTTGGIVCITPDTGYYCKVNNVECEAGNVSITANTTINFIKKDFYINSVDATKQQSAVTGIADIFADNTSGESNPILCVAVYDAETKSMLSCDIQNASTDKKPFTIDCALESNKTYIVKAMIWNAQQKPLTSIYTLNL